MRQHPGHSTRPPVGNALRGVPRMSAAVPSQREWINAERGEPDRHGVRSLQGNLHKRLLHGPALVYDGVSTPATDPGGVTSPGNK